MNDVAGICDICGRASRTLYTCWKCGARVCQVCYDPASGLCIRCAPPKRGGPWIPTGVWRRWEQV